MVNPTRDTTAGRVYNDLRNSARRAKRSTDEVMIEYVLERFLYRLATSPAGGNHFILKGGLLLAQFGARRMTRDIDILGRAFIGDDAEIIRRITAIAATEVDDGVTFDAASLKTAPIREDGRYHGLRLVMPASISSVSFVIVRDRSPITRRRPRRTARTSRQPAERRSEELESVLGATPHEFESRILRHSPRE
jgi:hypothetical protein